MWAFALAGLGKVRLVPKGWKMCIWADDVGAEGQDDMLLALPGRLDRHRKLRVKELAALVCLALVKAEEINVQGLELHACLSLEHKRICFELDSKKSILFLYVTDLSPAFVEVQDFSLTQREDDSGWAFLDTTIVYLRMQDEVERWQLGSSRHGLPLNYILAPAHLVQLLDQVW